MNMKITELQFMIDRATRARDDLTRGSMGIEDLSYAHLSEEDRILRTCAVEHISVAIRQAEFLLNSFYRRRRAYDKAVEDIEA